MIFSASNHTRFRLICGLAIVAGSINLLLLQSRWGVAATPPPEKYRGFEKQGELETVSLSLLNRTDPAASEARQNRDIVRLAVHYLERNDREAADSWMRYGYDSGSPAMLMFYGDYCRNSADPADWRTAAVCYRRARDAARLAGVTAFAAEADRKFREIEQRRKP